MPQTGTQLVADVTTDHKLVTGPDGKQYRFSTKWDQKAIDSYFKRKNIVAKPATKTKTPTPGKTAAQEEVSGASPGNVGMMQAFTSGRGVGTALYEGTAAAVPSVLAGAGGTTLGILGGPKAGRVGAAIGGFVGEDVRQMMMRPVLLARGQQDLTAAQSIQQMAIEGGKQAALQYAGEKTGEYFFKALDKVMPKAMKIKGIPLLPGDVNPNSKLSKYVEDLLSNLAPSAKTMAEFRAAQNAAITKKAETIANGFAKFNGTSEEMGLLLKNTVTKEEDLATKQINAYLKTLPPGQRTKVALGKDAQFQQMTKDYASKFRYELAMKVMKTNKPALIAGWLRNETTAPLQETRQLRDFIKEVKPEVWGDVKNRILRDVINETFTGSKDPTLKGVAGATKNFSGSKLKQLLDGIGEEKLKVIYGPQGAKSIKDFESLVMHIDKTQGSGMGRFLNLSFILPFRGGVTAQAGAKVAAMAIGANRLARVMTSTEGVRLYENYIRAVGQNAPRAISLSVKEIEAFNKRSDAEDAAIKKNAQEEFQRQMQEEQGGSK